ncbi:MAG: polysaccharide deacetylase family protein [Deltaproteobacteria bacterium]|nr:polysaccharide deacetylase family protein [Deltaproteobacteria bacterium]
MDRSDDEFTVNETLKKALQAAFKLPLVRRAALARLRDRATVVMYHGVVPDSSPYDAWTLLPASQFQAQLEFIREHFTPVTIDQVLNPPTDLRKPALAVTFDDGLRNNLATALPLLESYEIPATVYVSTRAIEAQELFWWDRITLALQHSRATELDLSASGLGIQHFANAPARKRWEDIERLLSVIKQDGYAERESVATQIAEMFLSPAEMQVDEFSILTVDELRELAASELITIGSHTHSHELLPRLSLEEARQDIEQAIEKLENWLGIEILHFAYPGGDHTTELVELVRAMRVDTAVTIVERRVDRGADPLAIPRFGMGGYDATLEWQANLIGLTELKARFSGGAAQG